MAWPHSVPEAPAVSASHPLPLDAMKDEEEEVSEEEISVLVSIEESIVPED